MVKLGTFRKMCRFYLLILTLYREILISILEYGIHFFKPICAFMFYWLVIAIIFWYSSTSRDARCARCTICAPLTVHKKWGEIRTKDFQFLNNLCMFRVRMCLDNEHVKYTYGTPNFWVDYYQRISKANFFK
jgi:hypothetical protein